MSEIYIIQDTASLSRPIVGAASTTKEADLIISEYIDNPPSWVTWEIYREEIEITQLKVDEYRFKED